METHQVRYFLAVCEERNFTRAAERCGVAQPSLTRAIGKLEDELGGALFRRERRRTELTAMGRAVRPHMEAIRDAQATAVAQAAVSAAATPAAIRLGIMCTLPPGRLIHVLGRVRRALAATALNLREATGSALLRDLNEGEIDAAVLALPAYPGTVAVHPLFEERYVVAFAAGHRFEDFASVPLSALEGEPYLSRVNCEFPAYLEAVAGRGDLGLAVRFGSEQEDWIRALVAAGAGCAIMPESLATGTGVLSRPLDNPPLSRTVGMATLRSRRADAGLAALVRLFENESWHPARNDMSGGT